MELSQRWLYIPTPLVDVDDIRLRENNGEAMNSIMSGSTNLEFVKVMHYDTTKEMWSRN